MGAALKVAYGNMFFITLEDRGVLSIAMAVPEQWEAFASVAWDTTMSLTSTP